MDDDIGFYMQIDEDDDDDSGGSDPNQSDPDQFEYQDVQGYQYTVATLSIKYI